ncbi:MAG: ATP-binding protein [Oscillospiraceae bacterium]|jgi:predicted DNA-binding ribbon-helix-helix protein|nr:ATP-binding protein [Oscillospiraceae bacterium]
MRKMPIGIQTFERIITDGYAYVDKTAWVYELAKEGLYYFLGRPRRFGKSLLLSTLRAYFEGKRELFEGLAIEKLEKEWAPYPVLHINLNVKAYKDAADLESGLDANLRRLEKAWNLDGQATGRPADVRFYDLIQAAQEQTGRSVVVLIDEYDRPLTQTMERGKPNDDIRNALKGFYGVLKSTDEWLRFVLLTGVTKFSKVSVFSDLNMLRDISMEEEYAGICGITAQELEDNFKDELAALAERNDMTYGEAVAEMKKRYDGYRFAKRGEGMFNPYSVLNAFAKKEFAYYWFETGTPTFLVEQIKKDGFDPLRFAKADSIKIPAESINDYYNSDGDPVPLLYQSGYLTITGYDRQTGEYTVAFPNEEVRYGFLNALLPVYTYRPPGERGFYVRNFLDDLRAGDVDGFMERMRSFFADIPYDLGDKTERHYQLVFYLVFTLLGQYARAEMHSAIGRADLVVWTADTIYVFEFKLNGTVEDALRQIDAKGYGVPYESDGRKIVKIGAEFDADARNIGRYLVADNG